MMEQRISTSDYIISSSRSSAVRSEDIDAAARSLQQNDIDNYEQTFGFGSMSCSVYDSA